ncbi:MAG TPA: hypothetical protein VGM34_02250 [Chlamydiales bacterium]
MLLKSCFSYNQVMQLRLVRPAPLLNTSEFELVFSGDSPQIAHFECVGLPGTVLEIAGERGNVLEVRWPFYSDHPLYVDKRFGQTGFFHRPACAAIPSIKTLLERMEQRIGISYVWGGNWAAGISEMLHYYPPKISLSSRALELWTLKGLDCSGLLFEASEGTTPRNTSQLIHFGRSVSKADALKNWEPMDMILYPGHVLFVRDKETIIESKSPFGVRVCNLQARLEELLEERIWVDEWSQKTDPTLAFMARRFSHLIS